MNTFVTILLVWLAVSLPLGLILGRMLRRSADEQTVPEPSTVVYDYSYHDAPHQPVYGSSAPAYARSRYRG